MIMNTGLSFSNDQVPKKVERCRSFVCHTEEPAKTKKRVTFKVDTVDHVYTYPAVPEIYWSDLYWSDTELEISVESQRKDAEAVVRCAPYLVRCICHLHGYHDSDEETEAAKWIWAKSGCRGLEDVTMPLLEQRRRWAVQSILEIQERAQTEVPAWHQELLMQAWCERVGAASIRFARHLAEIDEEESGGAPSPAIPCTRCREETAVVGDDLTICHSNAFI
jgi:hypothetical protein